MQPYRSLKLLGIALAAAVSLAATSARAQPTPPIALDRFDPAPAGDRMFGVQSPFAAGHMTPHMMLLIDYAHNPLVVSTRSGPTLGAIVGNQLFLHLSGSFSLWDRLNVNLDVPLALAQSGDNPSGGGFSFSSPSGGQIGDLRVGLRLRILGDYHDTFQLAVGGYVWFPTGARDSFVSDEYVRGAPQLIAGGRGDRLVWSAAVGTEFRPSQRFAAIPQGTMMRFGGGVGFLVDGKRHLQIGPELSAALTLDGVNNQTTNVEVLVDARYRVIDDLEIGLGVGPGLTRGIGTPDLRGIVMAAYTPEQNPKAPPPPDRDGDGIPDSLDACPDKAGVTSDDAKKNGCPPDRDGDGIPDSLDACPDKAGVTSDDAKKNGCPPDRDGDGIPDSLDACPDKAGVTSDDAKKNGCPSDRDDDGVPDSLDACPDKVGVTSNNAKKNGCPPDYDEDGIADAVDACPDRRGDPNPDPAKNGCPTVEVGTKEIFILDQVEFDTGKATIKESSDSLLDKVANVLKEHPELAKIEVQGHTDNRGPAALNKNLSRERAEAVRKALIKRGLADNRLTSRGYGQDKPIDTNDTEEGRQKNRRVQFVIMANASK
jgi:OmpA-OmpF porin, OOP family